MKALLFAMRKHAGQTRKVSGMPYITHPVAVAAALALLDEEDAAVQDAALLHDTLEDTETTVEELNVIFGLTVSSLVVELTNDEAEIEKIGKLSYLKIKLLTMSETALTIKLADRLCNMQDAPTEKSRKETRVLMEHLRQNRSLSMVQDKLVNAICEEL